MNFLNMSFHNGTTRFVVTIPWLGIALKFAHIHPIKALETLVWMAEHSSQKLNFREGLSDSDSEPGSFRYQFRGIYCNLREHRFYRSSRNPFLWPTLFSFFGLINIQPFAEKQPLVSNDFKLWKFVYKITGNAGLRDGHTLSEENNFAIDVNNFLRILDYGSVAGQEVISNHGHQLYIESRQLFS